MSGTQSSRTCTTCGETYPLTPKFYYHSRGPKNASGFYTKCKACCTRSVNGRDYVLAKMLCGEGEKVCKACLGAFPANADYFPPYKKASDGLNYRCRACARAQRRREYVENVERYQQSNKRYRRENALALRRYRAMRRADRHTDEHGCSADDIWQMAESQDWLCAYCETPLFGEYHVDHMLPLSRGGSNRWDNLALTCPECNLRKHIMTAEEYMNTRR